MSGRFRHLWWIYLPSSNATKLAARYKCPCACGLPEIGVPGEVAINSILVKRGDGCRMDSWGLVVMTVQNVLQLKIHSINVTRVLRKAYESSTNATSQISIVSPSPHVSQSFAGGTVGWFSRPRFSNECSISTGGYVWERVATSILDSIMN